MDPPSLPAWRLLPLEIDQPGVLVARGRALLDALESDPTPVLRWYRATSTAIVLGRGQGEVLAREAAERAGVAVLTRHSGGGAVLMDPHLLSLDVVLPAGHPLLDGNDLGAVFLRLGRAWASGLGALGVPDLVVHDGPAAAKRRGSPREQLLAAICYATLGRGEVTSGGRKLVGLAQRRRRHGALVQCGLLRSWRPQGLLTAMGADPTDAEIAGAAVGLDELGFDHLSERAIVDSISRAVVG